MPSAKRPRSSPQCQGLPPPWTVTPRSVVPEAVALRVVAPYLDVFHHVLTRIHRLTSGCLADGDRVAQICDAIGTISAMIQGAVGPTLMEYMCTAAFIQGTLGPLCRAALSTDNTNSILELLMSIGSNDTFQKAPATLCTLVRDECFLPLAEHTIHTPALVHQICRAFDQCSGEAEVDDRAKHQIFLSPAVIEHFFIRLVPVATTPQAVNALTQSFCSLSGGTASTVFATERMRDGFLLPLVRYATTPDAVENLACALCNCVTVDSSAAVFATAAMRDEFFLQLRPYAVTRGSAEWLLKALLNLINGADAAVGLRRDVFATASMRDHFIAAFKSRHPSLAHAMMAVLGHLAQGQDAGRSRRRKLFGLDG